MKNQEISIELFDKEFNRIDYIDVWESFIWTDRYYEAGDFEISVNVNSSFYNHIKDGNIYYLYNPNSEHIMKIDYRSIESDSENGTKVIIKGSSIESLLKNRVCWNYFCYAGNIQKGIKKLLEENVINPTNTDRKIEIIQFKENTSDHYINKIGVDIQLTAGTTIYDAICDLCKTYDVGFKMTWDQDNNKFIFELYRGLDRRYDNLENNNPVTFSSDMDNLLSSNFVENKENYKNVILVGGEGEGDEKKFASVGDAKGLDRIETFVDASSISSKIEDYKILYSEYERYLKQRGKEELKNIETTKAYEGSIESTQLYVFRKDFFVGDIVELKNEYGEEGTVRITESVESYDENGYSLYPNFVTYKFEPAKLELVVLTPEDNKTFSIYKLQGTLNIDWGDDKKETDLIFSGDNTTKSHTYEKAGTYTIYISMSDKTDIEFCPSFNSGTDVSTGSLYLKGIKVPNGVTKIPDSAFKGARILSDVELPASITELEGTYAFQQYSTESKLVSINLPNSITTIGEGLFSGQSYLSEANFPYSCETVPANTFASCARLKSISFGKGVKSLTASCVNNCAKLSTISFGSTLKNYVSGSVTNCAKLGSVLFGYILLSDTDTYNIPKDIFSGCGNLTSMEVKAVRPPTPNGQFSGTGTIGSVTVPDSPNNDSTIKNLYVTNWGYSSDVVKEENEETTS